MGALPPGGSEPHSGDSLRRRQHLARSLFQLTRPEGDSPVRGGLHPVNGRTAAAGRTRRPGPSRLRPLKHRRRSRPGLRNLAPAPGPGRRIVSRTHGTDRRTADRLAIPPRGCAHAPATQRSAAAGIAGQAGLTVGSRTPGTAGTSTRPHSGRSAPRPPQRTAHPGDARSASLVARRLMRHRQPASSCRGATAGRAADRSATRCRETGSARLAPRRPKSSQPPEKPCSGHQPPHRRMPERPAHDSYPDGQCPSCPSR